LTDLHPVAAGDLSQFDTTPFVIPLQRCQSGHHVIPRRTLFFDEQIKKMIQGQRTAGGVEGALNDLLQGRSFCRHRLRAPEVSCNAGTARWIAVLSRSIIFASSRELPKQFHLWPCCPLGHFLAQPDVDRCEGLRLDQFQGRCLDQLQHRQEGDDNPGASFLKAEQIHEAYEASVL